MESKIVNKDIILKVVEEKHSGIIAKWKNQYEFRKYSVGLNTIISDAIELNDILKSKETNQLYYIICEKNNLMPIGYIRINWMDDENTNAWLRFGLGEKRGNGYAKIALNLFIKNLFLDGTKRIDAEVFSYNTRSFNLLKNIGFVHEGTRRKAHKYKEEFYDIYTLGLLNNEFKEE